MRTCQSCGLENPDDRDFCECGEYLRWDPTGVVQAVTPDMVQKAAEEAPAPPEPPAPTPAPAPAPPPAPAEPPPAAITPATPPPAPPGNGTGTPVPKTAVQAAVPQPPAAPQRQTTTAEEVASAAITLRSPDRDAVQGEALAVGVEPGQRERVLGLVRNQSGIVDNYELRVDGLPDGWWSVFPDTVYLVPFGTGGTYEQEVEVHLHPPRSPDAIARIWNLRLVAHSKAQGREATAAPLQLAIQPYTETGTHVRPERAKGRRKADFDVAVENKANAPVLVALEGTDPDGELAFGFSRPPTEIPPGETINTTMRVKPPRQIWLGRPAERRLEVNTLTGEAAQERLAAEPVSAEELQQADGAPPPKRGLFGRGGQSVPGFYGPKVFKPQVQEPGLQIGPGGINMRAPKLRAPKVQAPRMKQANLKLSSLKMPGGGGGAAAPAAPLLPTQAVFRQKPWLPWWLLPIGMALAALAVLLYLLLPRNVVVPDVVGSATAFEAEQVLTEANLRLAPQQKEEVSSEAEPGTVLEQTPPAGERVEKDSEVTLLVAIGAGDTTVPKIVGLTPAEADQVLREENLTLGQASPQPIDPEGKIESQIPAAEEVVPQGTPVNIFFPEPGAGGGGGDGGGGEEGENGGGGGGGGGGAPAAVTVAAVAAGTAAAEAAQAAAESGLVPQTRREFHPSEPGTVFGTDPAAGAELKEGDKITLLVSAGFPELVFDNEKDILRINGANGDKLDPIADGPTRQQDPTFSHDGKNVAFVGGKRIFLADLTKPKATPIPLTQDTDEFVDLAWAPTTDANVLAMARIKGDERDLCLGRITGDGLEGLDCKAEPRHLITSAIRWAPEGKELLAAGIEPDTGAFGIVRWRSRKAFSPDIDDWSRGRFVTDISQVGEGVIDAAISDNGKRMAVVVKSGSSPFRLMLTGRDDFSLANAKPTGVRACKVTWRPDGRELAVVQADAACAEQVGSIVRLPANKPEEFRQLNASGDNPVFEPLTLGG